jgi:hypothetical protein
MGGRIARSAVHPQIERNRVIMSRIKTSKSRGPAAHKDWPVVVYMWSLTLAILGYVAARTILYTRPHPYHWLAALLGGLAGIPIGWCWYRWRGDVI